MRGRRGFSIGCILAASTLVLFNSTADAQLQGEAIPGAPFGIARVTVPLTARDRALYETHGYELFEENGRTLYPAFTSGAVNRILGDIVGDDSDQPPTSLTALFLFTGDEPLKVSFVTSKVHTATIVPRAQRRLATTRMMRTWWREYHAAARQQAADGDYPPLMDTYLTSMLAARLGYDPPLLSRIGQEDPDEFKQTLQLLFGAEKLRAATMRDTMLRQGGFGEAADRPVPRDVAWTPPAEIAADAEVDIEPMAMHVPEECFYVRFGKFSNYLWLDDLTKDYGGDISSMINLRGHDAKLNQRMQDQLVLEQTKLSKLFGGQVIADIAMIGRDMYMREGAAIGILFQAKNNLLFSNDLKGRRETAQKLHAKNGATLKTVKIAGHDVSFLSTPDNRLRSYYAVDGNYHLVTTSNAMVKRFYEAGAGDRPLGASAEFRHARTAMPTSREDTIFAYMSSAFFRGLISPQYQIELARRIQSVTDMELLKMAKLAARAEGVPGDTIDDLVAAKLLPAGFGRRPDGSGAVLEDNRMFDSLRGARGSFTPVPDVEIRGVTRTEETRYASRAAYYRDNWKQMDPLMVGVKRYALEGKGQERVVIDANISPFGAEKYGSITSILGPPTKERITTAPGDIISVQASVKGGLLSPSVPPHYLFARVQDVAPPETDLKPGGFFKTLQILKTTPGYLGAWPKPGFLDMLPFKIGGDPDINGFSPLPFGVWRWQGGGFSNFSFDQRMLADVAPHLKPEPTDDPAQIRIQVGDLAHSNLASWVSSLTYARATQTSIGNVRMLHNLTQQFHVPREEALATAEQLLDVKLMCSLGGKYETVSPDTGVPYWVSSKWPAGPSYVRPEDYESPLLAWFRGLDAGLTQSGDRMLLHAQLDMQRKATDSGLKLPSFDLFGPKKPDKKDADKDKPEEVDSPKNPTPREF